MNEIERIAALEKKFQEVDTDRIAALKKKLQEVDTDRIAALKKKLQEVYTDRNLIVALLLRMCASNRWRVGTMPATDASEGFSRVAVIETPEGQIAWHFPDAEQGLFEEIDKVFGTFPEPWDGHSTELKFERMRTIIATIDRLNRQMLGEKVAAKANS